MISDDTDRAFIEEALAAGAADVLSKPVEREMLMVTIRHTVSLSHLLAVIERQERTLNRCIDHDTKLVEQ